MAKGGEELTQSSLRAQSTQSTRERTQRECPWENAFQGAARGLAAGTFIVPLQG